MTREFRSLGEPRQVLDAEGHQLSPVDIKVGFWVQFSVSGRPVEVRAVSQAGFYYRGSRDRLDSFMYWHDVLKRGSRRSHDS